MSEATHTPGPWHLVEHSWSETSVYDADENLICSASIEDEATEDTQEQCEQRLAADMQLIAAAPDLLEALKETLEAIALVSADDGMGPVPEPLPDSVIGKARAAIAKAIGISS